MGKYFRPEDGNKNDLRKLPMQDIIEEGKGKGQRKRIGL
jgi:hypothetical protein